MKDSAKVREQLHETYSEELFRYFFEDHPGCFLVAEEKGRIIGFILSIPQDYSMLRIIMLAVKGKWKKRGFGSRGGRDVGRVRVEDFGDSASLVKIGHGYFMASDPAASAAPENIRIAQGYLEMSNVEAVRAMTEMIEILRGYESYQRVIRSIDEANAKSINEVGRTS